MQIAILKCRDCGEELNRSKPFDEKDKSQVAISSGFAAGPCPKGCRSTFNDLNLNTQITYEQTPNAKGAGE
ncbi:MAG: hypothetical protein V4440_10335 [Pseudomonadota bacterium]